MSPSGVAAGVSVGVGSGVAVGSGAGSAVGSGSVGSGAGSVGSGVGSLLGGGGQNREVQRPSDEDEREGSGKQVVDDAAHGGPSGRANNETCLRTRRCVMSMLLGRTHVQVPPGCVGCQQ
jgi:hypothetical protein